jgi:hypothetical protein
VTYTRCCIDTIDSPDDEHKVAQNMYRIEINTYKRNLRQFGYLLELYRDARSPEYKIRTDTGSTYKSVKAFHSKRFWSIEHSFFEVKFMVFVCIRSYWVPTQPPIQWTPLLRRSLAWA